MKRQNFLDASVMLTGLSYGEHVMKADQVVDELKKTLKDCANSFVVRCQADRPMKREMYHAIARYAKETSMPFALLYALQHPPAGQKSHLDKELVREIKEIAGDLFLGEMFGEIGSEKLAKDEKYFAQRPGSDHSPMPTVNDMSEARRALVSHIQKYTDYNNSIDLTDSLIVEATAASFYDMEGGLGVPILEVFPGDPEKLIPFTRGAAISYKRKMWGTFIAHEWYAGFRHFDAMKIKRLDMAYKHLFMQGSNLAFLESGNTEIESYGVKLPYEAPLCQGYRNFIKNFHKFAMKNPRPKCGPYTSVAFIYGEDDAFTGFMGGAVYEQFGREEWGKGDAERSWNILSEVYRSPDFADPLAYASCEGLDLNHAPGYGTYDVISASAPLDVLSNYSYLIFVGHNTMNEELYNKLVKYVSGGGILLMSAAHLSTNPVRGRKNTYVNGGDVSELFGCKITGSTRKIHGLKYDSESIIPGIKYPGTPNKSCDPIFAEGAANYATVELGSGIVKAELYASFNPKGKKDVPVVVENKLGKGYSILLTHENYPGNPAVYPVYKNLVKTLLTHSHENAEVKVAGSDKVRFTLFFEETGEKTLYLLNTSYDVKNHVKVLYGGKTKNVSLAPAELKIIKL